MTAGVLLLNASFEPLRVISLFRAVCLIVDERAEIVDSVEGEFIRSPSVQIPHPSVVRLKRYVKVPFRRRTALNTRTVLARDRHECCYCGGKANTIDHIHPTSRGGENTWDNVVAACERCNTTKSDRTLDELGWTMRYQPTIPPDKYWLVVGWTEREQWNTYIAAYS